MNRTKNEMQTTQQNPLNSGKKDIHICNRKMKEMNNEKSSNNNNHKKIFMLISQWR